LVIRESFPPETAGAELVILAGWGFGKGRGIEIGEGG
jgi:hypothetical protein